MISYFKVDDVLYRTPSWADVELFIDTSAFTEALPLGSYVD